MPGPQETRLLQALNGAMPGNVKGHAKEWRDSSAILQEVAARLAVTSMPIPDGDAGQKTATAMNTAFAKASKAMYERAAKLDAGHGALTAAAQAMSDARDAHAGLGDEQPAPTYTPPDDPGSEEGIKHHNQYVAKLTAYQAGVDHREKVSKAHADKLDEVFQQSSATMKQIHGEPDPKPKDTGGGGGGTGAHGGGTTAHHRNVQTVTPIHVGSTHTQPGHVVVTPTDTTHHHHQDPPTTTDPNAHVPGPTDPGTTSTPPGVTPIGVPSGTSTDPGGGGFGVGTGVGVVGATGAGAGAGVLGAGLLSGIRGGSVPVTGVPAGTAQSAVRGIGTTTRVGGSSTLGRSSTVGESEGAGSTSRAGAAGSGGRSASRSTGRAGGRSAGAGGRGGRGKDDKKGKKRDLFDVDEDWVDDEEAAPSLLD